MSKNGGIGMRVQCVECDHRFYVRVEEIVAMDVCPKCKKPSSFVVLPTWFDMEEGEKNDKKSQD